MEKIRRKGKKKTNPQNRKYPERRGWLSNYLRYDSYGLISKGVRGNHRHSGKICIKKVLQAWHCLSETLCLFYK